MNTVHSAKNSTKLNVDLCAVLCFFYWLSTVLICFPLLCLCFFVSRSWKEPSSWTSSIPSLPRLWSQQTCRRCQNDFWTNHAPSSWQSSPTSYPDVPFVRGLRLYPQWYRVPEPVSQGPQRAQSRQSGKLSWVHSALPKIRCSHWWKAWLQLHRFLWPHQSICTLWTRQALIKWLLPPGHVSYKVNLVICLIKLNPGI